MTKDQEIETLKKTLLDMTEEIQDISRQLETLAESILRSQENE
jgi:hypothetical protein